MKQMNDQITVLHNVYKTAENEILGHNAKNVEYVENATIPGSNVHGISTYSPFGSKKSRIE
jgi:hypothetical protein